VTLYLVSPATQSRPSIASRSLPVRLGALALAVLFTASQSQAQGPMPSGSEEAQPTTASQNQQAATPATADLSTQAANSPSMASDNPKMEVRALPDAPSVPEETASVKMPTDLKAMMDDAAQKSQALTPPTSQKRTFRPGWFVLGVFGAGAMALGAWGYSVSDKSKGYIAATILFVPGAAAAGFGFYNAFHQKDQ